MYKIELCNEMQTYGPQRTPIIIIITIRPLDVSFQILQLHTVTVMVYCVLYDVMWYCSSLGVGEQRDTLVSHYASTSDHHMIQLSLTK